MLDAAIIETRLKQGLAQAQVTIEDPRGDGAYLVVHVSAAQFADLNLVERHRAIFKALGEKMLDAPPVLSLRTYLPDVRA